ncbi:MULTISPECIES: hypothetical protein [Micrococcaceae]|uniref:hypothetical protein n=1 Tax=Micrococcaceae TaxID=1268 RepID=UPI000EAEEFC3|nr:hypothetical protein [Arthrobacter sp. AG1021]
MADLKNVDVLRTQSAEALISQDQLPGMDQSVGGPPAGDQSGKPGLAPENDSGEEDYKKRQRQSFLNNAQHRDEMRKHVQEKAKQENELRSSFFSVAVAMAFFVLVCSNMGVLVYIAQTNGAAHHLVLSAWLVSVVAEVIAIMHIIAKYLFPAPMEKQDSKTTSQ